MFPITLSLCGMQKFCQHVWFSQQTYIWRLHPKKTKISPLATLPLGRVGWSVSHWFADPAPRRQDICIFQDLHQDSQVSPGSFQWTRKGLAAYRSSSLMSLWVCYHMAVIHVCADTLSLWAWQKSVARQFQYSRGDCWLSRISPLEYVSKPAKI